MAEAVQASLSGMLAFQDTEQLSLALSHTDVSAMQLSTGKFHARLGQRELRGWTLQYVEFLEGTTTCTGSAAPDRHAFLIPIAIAGDCRLLGGELDEGSIGVYAPGGEHADVSTGGLVEVVLTPPLGGLDDAMDRGELPALPGSGSFLRSIRTAELKRLREALQRLGAVSPHVTDDPRTARSIADMLELLLVATMSDTDLQTSIGRPPLPRPAVLRRVAEALESSEDEPIYASELARLTDVSYPTLRRIFVEWFGTSPTHYLLLKRLYIARRRLLSGNFETVSDAAMSCGFWELGRFAQRYRSLFGELPSTTLARAAATHQ